MMLSEADLSWTHLYLIAIVDASQPILDGTHVEGGGSAWFTSKRQNNGLPQSREQVVTNEERMLLLPTKFVVHFCSKPNTNKEMAL